MLFEKCPVCGGELVEKMVEKLLRGGNDTAVIEVKAEVCLRCGERLFDETTIKRFEEVRIKLAKKQTAEFEKIGSSYQVAH
jgi:YgiT-type zinc finger domain-containing protein